MGVDDTCLMGFCAADNNTVGTAFHNVKVHIRIILGMRRFGTVAFRIGHSAVGNKVVGLAVFNEFQEIFMVMGAMGLIAFIGCAVNCVKTIHAYTALEASRCFLTAKPLHFYLFAEVIGTLMDMGKTVDLFTGDMGCSGHKIFIFRHLSQIVGHTHGI